MNYSFNEDDSRRAYEEWGANCGPNSLAFFLGKSLDDVRGKIPEFEEKGYTSPTMMKAALKNFGRTVTAYGHPPTMATMFGREPSLVRVQWCGPWTRPDANPKWAYQKTHWLVAFNTVGLLPTPRTVFDVNGGIRSFESWEAEIVPALIALYPRADGKWFPTHVWRLD